jgi:hypothetical protein
VHALIYERVLAWMKEVLRAYNEHQQREHRARLDEEERVGDASCETAKLRNV